jgi:DNA-directed RNA polymerase specialized sigma24 family protein
VTPQEQVTAWVRSLPRREQLALSLCLDEGLTVDETAAVLEVEAEWVDEVVRRARAATRAILRT